MSNFRYSLEKYSGMKSRFICPNCGKKELVRYIDLETGNYIDETVGKCNRIENCGYHFTPKMFFEKNGISRTYFTEKRFEVIKKETHFFDEELLITSLHSENQTSNLFEFLINHFDKEKVNQTFQKYLVGVSEKYIGAVIFWQVDKDKRVRAGKIMNYNKDTGRRNKNFISWIKRECTKTEVKQCFFGLHLVDYFKEYKIAIVESEKTALICDLFFDEKILWLSTGGMKGLTENKMSDLAGRNIILFPDLSSRNSKNNAFDEWKDKAKQIGKKLKMNIEINNFLELFSDESDKENQEDLGDFIIKNLHTEKKY
jgi:predicted RNA-binding Zn-ribbon protein involved in translation (DUF1610 family)